MSLLFFGCGGAGGGGGAGVGAEGGSQYTVSGTASFNGAALAGVTLTIAGVSPVVSDAAGKYLFTVQNGQYVITPSLTGYTFFPASQTMTVANGNLSVPEFTATADSTSFKVFGRVSLNGVGLSGVTLELTGSGTGTASTDANGNYSFTGVRNGACTLTPSRAGYIFEPLSQAVSVANKDFPVADFTASALPAASGTFSISGTVTLNGSGLAGVVVSISGEDGATGQITTFANGKYTFVGVRNGRYNITPRVNGYSFAPSDPFSVNNANLTGKDFSALPQGGGSVTITL